MSFGKGWHVSTQSVLKLDSNQNITLLSVSNDMKGKEIKKPSPKKGQGSFKKLKPF